MSEAASAPPRRPAGWIVTPWLMVVAFAVGVCGLWVYERGEAERRLDGLPAQAAARGLALTLGPRSFSGFPFRLRIRIAPVRIAPVRTAATGGVASWAAEAPELLAQAYVFAPRKWVFVAPAGVTVTRPQGGDFELKALALRASVSGLGSPAWLTVLQADEARLAPRPGARAPWLQSARRMEFDVRPSKRAGGTDVLLQVDGGVAAPESVAWTLASGAPFDLALTGRATHGAFALERLAAEAGPVSVSSPGGSLRAAPDGRLEGAVAFKVRPRSGAAAAAGTPAAAAISRAAAGKDATLDLVFADGRMRLAAPGSAPPSAP